MQIYPFQYHRWLSVRSTFERITLERRKAVLTESGQRISFIYGPLNKTWIALEAEKEALLNENSEINTEEENSLIAISCLMDHVILLLDQAVNICTYIRRINILMSFMSNNKKVEMMLKETMKKCCMDPSLRKL